MLVVVSPAKRLDFESETLCPAYTQPLLLDQAELLAERARKLNPRQIRNLMGVSARLAEQTHQRFQDFAPPFNLGNARQAIFAFKGDTYLGLEAESLDDEDLAYAQDHLRILSGLYGLLRPLDLMQAYRLEMGSKLRTRRGKDLYAFWGDRLTETLGASLNGAADPMVINCASREYAKALKPARLPARIVTPAFKEVKGGVPRMLGMFAKKARGMMARYIVQNRVRTFDDLLDFSAGGYKYAPELSSHEAPVFTRPQPAPVR
jgi:cytoplasmic iron level regulating protein YaaA (DUF328/UPF0246 family)